MASFVCSRPPSSGETGSRAWKVDGAVLDLQHDVVIELAVERMEDVVGSAGAISLRVAPVEVMVVDECAVENDSAVRLQRAGEHIGGVGGCASVTRGAELAFGIGFHGESGEVGNERVDFDRLSSATRPATRGSSGSKVSSSPTVCGLAMSTESAMRTPQGRKASAIRASSLSEVSLRASGAALTLFTLQPLMPTEASRRAYSLTRREVGADVSVVEEDGAARVSALDAAIGVVPLIDPADGRGRRLLVIESLRCL